MYGTGIFTAARLYLLLVESVKTHTLFSEALIPYPVGNYPAGSAFYEV